MILCVGTTPVVQRTLTFERVDLDAVNRAKDVVVSASGKSLNVARVLATLNEPCLATGFAGGDGGKFIRANLDEARIPHDFVEVAPNTRTCTTIIDRATADVTELVEESREVEPDAWDRLAGKIEQALTGAKLLVLSGSLTPNAPQDFYAWCVRTATAKNVRAIVDASGEPLDLALQTKPYVVKPNRSELKRTFGTDDLKEGVRRLIRAGATWAIVTMGKEGSIISDGEQFWSVKTPSISAVSAIGSGDSYAAGLAAAIVRGQALPEAAKLGAACAAANAMIPVPGNLRIRDVDMLLPQIQLVPL